ncbi:MAG: DEAD/DEAH box helicase [Christensenellales bacterium]|jgi:ATP-dependent RNA helicase DeaD
MSFNKLGLNESTLNALDNIGLTTPTEVQQQTIPAMLSGKDVLVRSQTGSGKTLAFVLPIIEKLNLSAGKLQAVILAPTRELALQITEQIEKLMSYIYGLQTVCVYGGDSTSKQARLLKQKKPQILVGTTGRVNDLLRRKILNFSHVNTIILDEADTMLDMGFLEDIETILSSITNTKQTALFSATFPKGILSLTSKFLSDPQKVEIGTANQSLENIRQHFINVPKQEKMEHLAALLNKMQVEKTIIFTNTKAEAQKVSDFLNQNKMLSQAIHGDLFQSVRKKVLTEFKAEIVKILVASDVAARGLDIKDVDYVINYDIPSSVEFYLHRIGRTARAGKKGVAITLLTNQKQADLLKQYARETKSELSELTLGYKVTFAKELVEKKNRKQSFVKAGKAKKQFSGDKKAGFDKKDRKTREKSFDRKDKFGKESFERKDKFDRKDNFERRERSSRREFSDKKDGFRSERPARREFSDKKDGFKGRDGKKFSAERKTRSASPRQRKSSEGKGQAGGDYKPRKRK